LCEPAQRFALTLTYTACVGYSYSLTDQVIAHFCARESFMAGFSKIELGAGNKRLKRFMSALLMLSVAFAVILAPGVQAQNDKKKKKGDPPKVNNDSANPVVPMSDEQQIDYMLSEYLGAWQLGDTEKLHKEYSDDVSVVTGGWSAPAIGWTNYLAMYQQQR